MKEILIVWAVIFVLSLLFSYIEFKIKKDREPIIGLILVGVAIIAIVFGSASHTHWFWKTIAVLFLIIPIAIARVLVRKKYKAYAEDQRQKQLMLQHRAMVETYNGKRDELIQKYGQPTKSIQIRDYDFDNDIDVFEGRQLIKIGTYYIPFSNIKKHSLLTDTEIRKGRQYMHGNIAGSLSGGSYGIHGKNYHASFSGGSFSGNFGGVIESENDHVEENMTLCLSTGEISNPIIYFEIGNDKRIAKEVDEILKIIEEKNSSINSGNKTLLDK